jgi:protein-S-isoprenylcysteine O-methyltransferase Ste14
VNADDAKPGWIVRVPSPIWLIGLIAIALVADRWLQLPAILEHQPTGVVLIVIGLVIAVSGVLTFRLQRAEIAPSSEKHSTLVASGPFKLTRNPMYLGLVVIGVGAALMAGTWLMWLVPVIVFLLDEFVIIPFEERSVERAYGDAFRAYKARVRRWL